MRKQLIMMTALLIGAVGCKVNPAPPSVEDAKAVWNKTNNELGLGSKVQLIDLKQTDGQFAEVNGVKVYTLFYDAQEKFLAKVGNKKPGDFETVHSNYGFQKTENGWQGPDGTHFDH